MESELNLWRAHVQTGFRTALDENRKKCAQNLFLQTKQVFSVTLYFTSCDRHLSVARSNAINLVT